MGGCLACSRPSTHRISTSAHHLCSLHVARMQIHLARERLCARPLMRESCHYRFVDSGSCGGRRAGCALFLLREPCFIAVCGLVWPKRPAQSAGREPNHVALSQATRAAVVRESSLLYVSGRGCRRLATRCRDGAPRCDLTGEEGRRWSKFLEGELEDEVPSKGHSAMG